VTKCNYFFSNPAEFQVHFIGSVENNQSLEPLFEKYLASIPSQPNKAAATQEKMVNTLTLLANNIQFTPNIVIERVPHRKSFLAVNAEATGLIHITFPIPNVATRLEFDALEIVATVVESLLFNIQQSIKDASAILSSYPLNSSLS